jgi:hypothetical protein
LSVFSRAMVASFRETVVGRWLYVVRKNPDRHV